MKKCFTPILILYFFIAGMVYAKSQNVNVGLNSKFINANLTSSSMLVGGEFLVDIGIGAAKLGGSISSKGDYNSEIGIGKILSAGKRTQFPVMVIFGNYSFDNIQSKAIGLDLGVLHYWINRFPISSGINLSYGSGNNFYASFRIGISYSYSNERLRKSMNK